MCWCVKVMFQCHVNGYWCVSRVILDSYDVRSRGRGSLAVRLMFVGVLTGYHLTAMMSEAEGEVH